MALREREGGKRELPLVDRAQHVSICIILTRSLFGSIILLFLRNSFWNEALCSRVTGFTFGVELMELNTMAVLRVQPVFRAGLYPCVITASGVTLNGWWRFKTGWSETENTSVSRLSSRFQYSRIYAACRVSSKSGEASEDWRVRCCDSSCECVFLSLHTGVFPVCVKSLKKSTLNSC